MRAAVVPVARTLATLIGWITPAARSPLEYVNELPSFVTIAKEPSDPKEMPLGYQALDGKTISLSLSGVTDIPPCAANVLPGPGDVGLLCIGMFPSLN